MAQRTWVYGIVSQSSPFKYGLISDPEPADKARVDRPNLSREPFTRAQE